MGQFTQKKVDQIVEEYYQSVEEAFVKFQTSLGNVKHSISLLSDVKQQVAADDRLTQSEVDDIQQFMDDKIKEVLAYIVNRIDNAKLKTMLEDITGLTITIS